MTSDSGQLPPDLRNFVAACKWTFAKTMPEWPHEYIVRDRVDTNLFESFVRCIRADGFEGRFYERKLIYLEHEGMLYWTMGEPVALTTVINRCKTENSYENRLLNGTLPEQRQKSTG